MGQSRERITIRKLGSRNPFSDIGEDVRAGLSAESKFLAPKYFYDEHGSWLFEEICKTPEYYLTRTEDALLATVADTVIEDVNPSTILELGSGSSRKTGHLLQACARRQCHARYEPFDVAGPMLQHAAERLIGEHDWLTVDALLGDYIHDLSRIPTADGARLYLFLGSTLGNFDEHEAIEFLRTLRSVMGMHDWFLLGVDRVKDVDVLRAAYNDAAGLTAEFNRNALHVINRALAGEFDPQAFAHRAEYNESRARIEMYLDSLTPQIVRIRKLDMEVEFAEGEPILTEISRKFTRSAVEGLLEAGGFSLQRWFEPENRFFSLVLARPTGAA